MPERRGNVSDGRPAIQNKSPGLAGYDNINHVGSVVGIRVEVEFVENGVDNIQNGARQV